MVQLVKKERHGNWLPEDRRQQAEWVKELIKKVNTPNVVSKMDAANNLCEFSHQEVAEFKKLLDTDPILHLLAEQMIEQGLEYSRTDPTGAPEIDSYDLMLRLIDHIMSTAPEYMQPGETGRGLIGFPINAILDWCMGTQAGYAFFLNETVNQQFEKILKKWCEYLSSSASVYVLNDSEEGWLCENARKELMLDEVFVCDPTDPHYGFSSWNDFFTRKFKPEKRPVASPDDPYVIASACESAPYKISTNVQQDTKFWVKEQPYSIEYMLDHSRYTWEFIGGTVYQAFLSAAKYHRWHSPVAGKIVEVKNIPGTYYAEVNTYPYDDAGPNNSQGYITHVAARAVAIIECDNPDIGLVAFIAVGMSEVSSCILNVKEGQHVEKGEEIGMFQFGGSTHCLIFQKDVIDEFVPDAIPAEDFNDSAFIEVRSKLATVKKKSV